ncbi:hypothetical protein L2E82_18629 [Cichorium intybus]|uniref:Uncharacterized protein n=1 Tax=Cichorium intybus TaxID=13427 RepID=A0ACB9F9Y2_CICIN|nr:hypothetical protein L2E82_18629 [Cichorium intybus]
MLLLQTRTEMDELETWLSVFRRSTPISLLIAKGIHKKPHYRTDIAVAVALAGVSVPAAMLRLIRAQTHNS